MKYVYRRTSFAMQEALSLFHFQNVNQYFAEDNGERGSELVGDF